MKKSRTLKLTLSAMCLGLAMSLPFLTGQIPQIGAMLCPMHIPVFLCGFLCGGPWGMLVGLIAPIFRSVIFGMPPMFPTAICMSLELATYGLASGLLHRALPRKKANVYFSLVLSMIAGRIVWGLAMLACMGFDVSKFGMQAFLSGAVLGSVPGIILQLIIIPVIVIVVNKSFNE